MRPARQFAVVFAVCVLGPVSTVTPAAAQDAQLRDGTIGPDDMGVCCRITAGDKQRFLRTSQRECSDRKGTPVAADSCPKRRTDGAGGLVCCEFRKSTAGVVIDQLVKNVSRRLMSAEACKKTRDSKVIATEQCVHKKTRAERLRACKERGEGYEFVDGRCLRPSVRDKRNDSE